MNMSVTFTKAPSAFALNLNANAPSYIYEIESLKLLVKKIQVNASHRLRIEHHLNQTNARYPIKHSYVKPLIIDEGAKFCAFENVFSSGFL